MSLSRSFLCFAVIVGVFAAAGCDKSPSSVTAPLTPSSKPNALIVPTGYSDVSVGNSYACAVRAVDGGLVCWGNNQYDIATTPTGKFTQVSAGLDHACALRTDYFVVCWGGTGFAPSENSPAAHTYSAMSAGNTYACGVRLDNRTMACWGANSDGMSAPPSVSFTQVSAGSVHTCGLVFQTGKVACWGMNGRGQTSAPDDVYTQVDVGANYTCAVRGDGTLACWGSNDYHQSAVPSGTYTKVSAGDDHTCAIRASDNAVVCWGYDRGGMITPPAGAYTKLSVGSDNACAIRADDLAIVCWGYNDDGQSSPPGISTARALPSASFTTPASVVALDSFFLNMYSARVEGFPQATNFTYRFDCGDGKGYGAVQTTIFTKCATRVAGTRTVRGKVIDQDGDSAVYSRTVPVTLRPQTVNIASTAPVYPAINSAAYTVNAKATSNLPVTITASPRTICASSGTTVSFVGMGGCTIAVDQKGDSTYGAARAVQNINVAWLFAGFYEPVRNAPYVNVVAAGRYVQIPFFVGGYKGASVLKYASPPSHVATCDVKAYPYTVNGTLAGTAGVQYNTSTARYVFTWKTDAAWAGTCRVLDLVLADGTTRSLAFKFP